MAAYVWVKIFYQRKACFKIQKAMFIHRNGIVFLCCPWYLSFAKHVMVKNTFHLCQFWYLMFNFEP